MPFKSHQGGPLSTLLSARSMAGTPSTGDKLGTTCHSSSMALSDMQTTMSSSPTTATTSQSISTNDIPPPTLSETDYWKAWTTWQTSCAELVEATESHAVERLPFIVRAWSSFSGLYHPRHILVDKPDDQSSRWSSATNNASQYLLLQLEEPCIVRAIHFGKFYKPHVCNLKEFKVFVGMTPESMIQVAHAGLHNDDIGETFTLRFHSPVNHLLFVARYVKIVPLMTWSAGFNYSIWHVSLLGLRGTNAPSRHRLLIPCYQHHWMLFLLLLVLMHFIRNPVN